MKTLRYTKIYQSPPLKDVRMQTSEILADDAVEARMNQLAAYTPDAPYIPADELHGLRWFANGISYD